MAEKDNPYEKLWTMINKARFAMFTTQEDGGVLRSRPMTTVQNRFDGSLWFFAKSDADIVRAIQRHARVSLSYGNSTSADFVAVSGTARIVTDVEKKRELWSAAVKAWFPEGPDAPTVVGVGALSVGARGAARYNRGAAPVAQTDRAADF